MFELVSNKK